MESPWYFLRVESPLWYYVSTFLGFLYPPPLLRKHVFSNLNKQMTFSYVFSVDLTTDFGQIDQKTMYILMLTNIQNSLYNLNTDANNGHPTTR